MKRILVIIGIIVLIFGLVLYLSPTTLASVANGTGISSSVVTTSETLLVTVKLGNYSDVQVALTNQDNLIASFQSVPTSVEFLLMNQTNFSQFASGSRSNLQIYNQSRLNASNYSFSFTPNTVKSENYYLVFSPLSGKNLTSNVDLSIKVLTQVSAFDVSYVPDAILVLAVILVGFGVFSGQKRKIATPPSNPPPSYQTAPSSEETRCKFCGASMSPELVFCPSCGRSQR